MIASAILLGLALFFLSPSRGGGGAFGFTNPFSRNSSINNNQQQEQQQHHPFISNSNHHNHHRFSRDAQFVASSFGSLHASLQSEESQHALQKYNDREPHVTHFLFLVHGYHGFGQDLAYLETVLKLLVDREKRKFAVAASAADGDGGSSNRHDMVVHCPTCNEHKTKDGVGVGGERLWQEMLDTIRCEMADRRDLSAEQSSSDGELKDITISMLGNSLGGLYSRYALLKLMEQMDQVQVVDIDDGDNGDNGSGESDVTLVLDGQYRVHLNIFCSTASPHLGISKHTYIPIPRTAEIGVAHTMGETGKDLFRLNDLLKTMATTPEYLQPLGRFRKRIAYANAYGTDFPVPTATAAFLHSESSYPHHIVEEERKAEASAMYSLDSGDNNGDDDDDDSDDCVVVDDNGLVVAIFHTKSAAETIQSSSPNAAATSDEDTAIKSSGGEPEHSDDLAHMSHALDSLGWKKVFVDLRNEIPIGVNLPRLPSKSPLSFQTPSFFDSRKRNQNSGGAAVPAKSAAAANAIPMLKRQGVVMASKDVASATSIPPDLSRLSWPLGHNMIVAFSRTQKSASFNKGGRPVVDALANELVEFIFSWEKR